MFFRFSPFSKGASKRDPQSSKRRPQGGQNAPQERPGRGQERPKRRQDGPRSRQKRPRSTPRAAQEAKKRSKKGYHLRFRSWGGSGRPPGAILKRFRSDFRASGVAFLRRFQCLFLGLKRSVEPARARGVTSEAPAPFLGNSVSRRAGSSGAEDERFPANVQLLAEPFRPA